MKRIERKHLKENELAHTLASAREFLEARATQVTAIIGVAAVLVVLVIGVTWFRQRSQGQGEQLLADAMVALNARVVPVTPGEGGDLPAAATLGATGTFSTEAAKLNAALPKLKAAADAFPDAPAGIVARYHLAGALSALGRYPEAITEFEQVVQKAGTSALYGRMAQLGRADAEVRSGQLDAAIATWKTLASQKDTDLPVDAILIELARAYRTKGNTEEARKTFTELVDQHPESPYSADARQELEELKG